VLLYDTGNRRTMLIAPDGHPVRTTPFGEFSGMFGMGRMSPREADAAGNWYGEANSMRSQREWPGDTYEETVVRARPLSPRLDTITTVRRPKFHATRFSQGVITAKSFGILAGDPWGVFSDGSAIVVRADTYTPESIDRTGTRLGAAPIPFVSVRVSERDREEHLDSLRGVYRDARVTTRDGSPPRITANVLGPDTWQEFHPPVLGERIAVDSRERAWVHRLDARRADGERYDLLDRNGRFIDAIRLPKGTKFVAMGTNVWYGTREDEDGLVYLQRFPLP
jgi:hypothetical protein